ncbi:MAG: hypothetical protein RMJ53_10210, partial [Chitinophagales bacterium]|nr:hypothetical protein [Chitinophagales bacterium]
NKENDKNENNQSSQNDNSGQTKNEEQKREHPKLSKQDAEKLLQALQNEEQKANQKMQRANIAPAKAKVEKDW